MKILITGSQGFIGGSIGRLAIAAGHDVLGVDLARAPGGWPGRYRQVDLTSAEGLSDFFSGFAPDMVLHAAGSASVGASFASPVDDLRHSLLTWANVLEAVRHLDRRPAVLFPSSAAVYGDPARLPVPEDAPLCPISPYGFHKVACELLAREYAACFGLTTIVCRFFSVFGAGQRRLLIWELYKQLAGPDSTVWIEGTGRESRDYLHIDDIAAALFQLVDTGRNRQVGQCLVVNLASGVETQVLDVADELRKLVAPGKTIQCRGLTRRGDPARWCGDVSRLRALIPSWRPQPLPLALTRCVAEWQRDHRP